VRDVADVTGRK